MTALPFELRASGWRLFGAALSAVLLLWLPVATLPILDGMLFVAAGAEVLRDLGLLAWLGMLVALLLALLATALRVGLALAGVPRHRCHTAAWCVVLLPLAWVSAWHTLRMAWQWLRTVAGLDLLITQELRLLAVALLVLGFAALVRRLTVQRLVAAAAATLLAARPLAAGVLLLGALAIAYTPPTVLWHDIGLAQTVAPSNLPSQTAQPVPGRRPDVLVISLDAVSALDAEVCNPASAHMPRLAAFAQGATCFDRFYTASNFTTPTTSTMESGLLPWSHFATQPDAKMAHGTRQHTLARVLQQAGWQTHFVSDNLLASPRHRGTFAAYDSVGFAPTTLYGNGFREALTVFPDTALPRLAATAMSFLGALDMVLHGDQSPYESERVYSELRQLLAPVAAGQPRQPLFVWAHTLPPHSPYLPPATTRYRLLPKGELEVWQDFLPDNISYRPAQQGLVDKHRLRYREAMMAADAALGDFLDELKRQGRLQHMLVVITSDHGESFEKGFLGHAGPLTHEALIRVPLVIKLPGATQGRVVTQPVSQADLAPTLLDWLGQPPLPQQEGRSLRPVFQGNTLAEAPVFSMTMERQSRFLPLTQGHFVMIDGPYKLTLRLPLPQTRDAASTLFNIVEDAAETHNLVSAQPERAASMQQALMTRLAAAEQRRLPLSAPAQGH